MRKRQARCVGGFASDAEQQSLLEKEVAFSPRDREPPIWLRSGHIRFWQLTYAIERMTRNPEVGQQWSSCR